MDSKTHLKRIEEAIDELLTFHPRTAAPARIPHQYLGTVIDNTVALLTAPANSLDGGSRSITFTDAQNWLSVMQAVHRSFFSSLQLAVEAGIEYLCAERKIYVESQQGAKMLAQIQAIQFSVEAAGVELPELNDLRKHFASYRPIFGDYLEAVLAATSLSRKAKKEWRRYFKAISIVRNKVSHSNSNLSDYERAELKRGGCAVMVSDTGTLVVNPRMYAQAAHFALQFFEAIYGSLPPDLEAGVHASAG